MKIIDLLNKIANGELKFEQEFEHNGVISDMEMFSNKYSLNEEILNNKIEIIEEEQDIEELNIPCNFKCTKNGMTSNDREQLDFNFKNIEDKINELIKAVNELKNKG